MMQVSRCWRSVGLSAAMILALATGTLAQDGKKTDGKPSDSKTETQTLAQSMVGEWELATAERGKTCTLTLQPERVGAAMRVDLDAGCGVALPFTREITGWSIRGLDIVRLQNADGDAVIDLSEVENDIFEGVRSGEGVFLLQDLKSAREAARSMDQMIGNWALMRGSGRRLCNMTLTNTEAAGGNFQVFLNAGCGPVVTGFNPVMWRLERGEIVLIAPTGESWHFQADDNAQWRRVPEEADPLLLARQ